MTEQYFAANPASKSDERQFVAEALGMRLPFWTDAGVFSKNELDAGTALLLKHAPEIRGRALDLGCGWGAVGIFLAKAYPDAELVLADVNERAVALANRNIAANRLTNARATISDGFAALDGAFDAILTNPPIRAGKRVIYRLFEDALTHLAPGGRLYIVIRKQQGAESAWKFLNERAHTERIARDGGFWILRAERKEQTT